MSNLHICNGVPLTEKDLECLAELSKMTEDDIDFSGIPRLTKEELKKFKPARLRRKNLQLAS